MRAHSYSYPAAAYGRGRDPAHGIGDPYQVLGHSPGFPPAGLAALKELAGSFQWAGGGQEHRYADCFALWRLPDPATGVLVARLRDAGHDQLHRPHSLRVEVVYVEFQGETEAIPHFVASLLVPQAWPQPDWSGPPAELCLTPAEPSPALLAVLNDDVASAGRLPRMLVLTHPDVRVTPGRFELQTDIEGRRVTISPTPSITQTAMPPYNAPSTKRVILRPITPSLFVLATAVALLAAWWGYEQHRAIQSLRDETAAEIAELRNALAEIEQKYTRQVSLHEAEVRAHSETRHNWKEACEKLGAYAEIEETLGVSGPEGLHARVTLLLDGASHTRPNAPSDSGKGTSNNHQLQEGID